MKKQRFLKAIIASAFFLLSFTSSFASDNKSLVKEEVTSTSSPKEEVKPGICSMHQTIRNTCCDGAEWVVGYVDVAYWCDSGEIYEFSYMYEEACIYDCI